MQFKKKSIKKTNYIILNILFHPLLNYRVTILHTAHGNVVHCMFVGRVFFFFPKLLSYFTMPVHTLT